MLVFSTGFMFCFCNNLLTGVKATHLLHYLENSDYLKAMLLCSKTIFY